MQFFEISYIPKGSKAFELVGKILSDSSLVKEMNQTAGEGDVFVTNIRVVKEEVNAEKPTMKYVAKMELEDRSTPEPVQKKADFELTVMKGDSHDCIVVSGSKEHEEAARLLLSHVRTKVLPAVGALENVIIVKP